MSEATLAHATDSKVRRVVIAGGGTAGWTAAAALSRLMGGLLDITLVESEEIGIVGVGEATIPTIRTFHDLLGIPEAEFLRETNGTFKLAIAFENWARDGDRYLHAFGEMGRSTWVAPFHHVWLQARAEGVAGPLTDHSLEAQAADAGRFQTGDRFSLSYAYHFDATLYGKYLRKRSEAQGVKRIEGRIDSVAQDAETGFVTALKLASGQVVEGDLFIDCTGFRGLLIEETLKTGYDDWSHWLPTDTAVACQTAPNGPLNPYTRAVAHDAGWRWRIPLQSRVGNGLVYCSRFLDDAAAKDRLVGLLDGPPITEPRLIRYQTGRRKKTWNKNVVALGLSSGFIEPLESTSIHLFQIGISRLIQMFPYDGFNAPLEAHYNARIGREVEGVRDFVILHYHLNQRDEPFWRERREAEIPDTLAERIGLFADSATAYQTAEDLFRVDSWAQVMIGQRLEPKSWHRIGSLMPREQLYKVMQGMSNGIRSAVAAMPTQAQFVAGYCGVRETA